MRTITKKIFKYNELDKKTQERLLEEEKKLQYELYIDNYLYDDLKEEAAELLKKYFKKATLKNIYYSLSYCQGDGAMMEIDLSYYNNDIQVKHEGFYYHSMSYVILGNYLLTEKQQEKLQEKIQALQDDFQAIAWKYVEYEPSEEDCVTFLQDNEYYRDGSLYMEE